MKARPGAVVVVLGLAACAVWAAVDRRWLCDDAFISFRYARNLLDGHGLVFNAEERVEGYTNFLWTMLCALWGACGLVIERSAQWGGIACFAGAVVMTARAGRALVPGDRALLPLAAAGCAFHRHLQEFASCGLETASFVLLVVALLDALLRAERPRGWALCGVLAALLGLSRPDGALFGLIGGAAALAWGRPRARCVLAYALPLVLAGAAFGLWKLAYYGHLLPNTFYAKSGNDPYPGQGLYYVWLVLRSYWVLLPAVVLLPVAVVLGRQERAPWLLAAFALGYLGFVVWVGGDFMFARFLLPVTPVLFLVLEWLVRRRRAAALRWGAVIVVGALTALQGPPETLLQGVGANLRGIVDERTQYPAERVQAIREVGRRMGEACPEARVVFFGTQAMLVHDAGFRYALEGTTGLTDPHLARMSLAQRGQIGHEKSIYADPAYALQRRVHFLLERAPGIVDLEPFRAAVLFGREVTLVRYDRALMARLQGRPDVAFIDFEEYLDRYLADLPQKDPARVRADYASFQLYYFAEAGDAARQAAFERFLAGR